MADFNNLSEHGQNYIIMAINDMIENNFIIRSGSGLYVGNDWLTPESCYWLYKFLSQESGSSLVSSKVLVALKNGCNHPELL